MASVVYPKWKEAIIQASANSSLGGTVKVILIDVADYTYAAAHDFLDDVPAAARVATSGALASKTYVNGTFDAADITITGVSGDVSEALIGFIDTGVEATSRLVWYMDSGTGLPFTPNSGNLDIAWNASGIFSI